MDIFVGSIPFKLKEKELKELFEKFGEVTSVKIVKSKVTRQNKGFAFVDMPNEEEIRKAIFELNGLEIMGRNLEVSISEKKDKSKPKVGLSTKLNSQGNLMTKKTYLKPFGMDKRNKR
jgi:RNA recognition motif-containing protein